MKRLSIIALAGMLLLVILLAGCGNREAGKGTGAAASGKSGGKLFIYNWTYYIPEDVIRDFEKEYGATVVYDVFASNEEMYAKLKAGGSGYDVVFPSGDYVSIMIAEGMAVELDLSRIPNFQHIDEGVREKITFDPGNRYSVPYMMGAAGIAVNTRLVPEYEKSWNIFARKDLADRMTMLDDMREVLGAALMYLGYSVNSVDPAELEQAKKVVLTWRDQILKFDAESFAKGFASEEFFVVQGYAENVFLEYDEAKRGEVDYFIPREGGPMYMDSMMILKGARNEKLAYSFIDFIHRPEIYARIADYLMLPSINRAARSLSNGEAELYPGGSLELRVQGGSRGASRALQPDLAGNPRRFLTSAAESETGGAAHLPYRPARRFPGSGPPGERIDVLRKTAYALFMCPKSSGPGEGRRDEENLPEGLREMRQLLREGLGEGKWLRKLDRGIGRAVRRRSFREWQGKGYSDRFDLAEYRELLAERVDRLSGSFRSHVSTWLAVNGFLFVINMLTSPGYPWFLYPLGGWGIGIASHAARLKAKQRELRDLDRYRIPDRAGFSLLRQLQKLRERYLTHLVSNTAVAGFLATINLINPGFPWALIPISALGIGVVTHRSHYRAKMRVLEARLRGAGLSPGGTAPGTAASDGLFAEAERQKQAIEAQLHELERENLPLGRETLPVLEQYLDRIRELSRAEDEISGLLAAIPRTELERDFEEFPEKAGRAGSERMAQEYRRSAEEISGRLGSIRELEDRHELIRLRLRSAVGSLSRIRIDLARMKTISGAEEGSLKLLREQSEELSRYLNDLQGGYDGLDGEL